MNKYFNKIFVISLFDQVAKFQRVKKQFKKYDTNVQRFVGIDGRCKDQNEDGCIDKLKTFEMAYNVKIEKTRIANIKELLPASSLTIGTVLILREMIKKKWKRVLICEDDIDLTRNFLKKFQQGFNEAKKTDWDLLYLGCGHICGYRGISEKKNAKNKYLSQYSEIYDDFENYYVQHKQDLRVYKNPERFTKFSDMLTWAVIPGGTWCYAVSLQGAKKILKLLNNKVGRHIDIFYKRNVRNGNLKALAFDPPIAMHENIINRNQTSNIPWTL